jgi:hypothetical protein
MDGTAMFGRGTAGTIAKATVRWAQGMRVMTAPACHHHPNGVPHQY